MALTIAMQTGSYMKAGQAIFVYAITSTATKPEDQAKELADYKTSSGEFYREDESKRPLMWSQRVLQPGSELVKSQKTGRYQVHQDLEAQAAELQAATTSNLGRIQALQQFTGMNKAQMTEKLIAAFAKG